MIYILSALGTAILLVALGEIAGTRTPLLKKIRFPGAVLGGLAGLIAGPGGFRLGAYLNIETSTQQIYSHLAAFPALFINIVFACLLLGKPIDQLSKVWNHARPHVVMGHIIAWGQYVVGISITLFILSPFLSVDPLVAPSIAIGFQGGHGTAAGLTANYQAFDFGDGKTIAYSIATIGVILATVIYPLLARVLLSTEKASDSFSTTKQREEAGQ
ncbi:MAG: sodium/glutamate symporter [Candidatus Electrothrix sp. GW3-4]|uniref:sodium/glutamate symporter n=1 Tax=Candidatus Electrothrix sp. GW3-4 TaxID=3126740 RepID=UPI0030CF86F5